MTVVLLLFLFAAAVSARPRGAERRETLGRCSDLIRLAQAIAPGAA